MASKIGFKSAILPEIIAGQSNGSGLDAQTI